MKRRIPSREEAAAQRLQQLRVFAWLWRDGNLVHAEIPATVVLRVLEARDDEAARTAARRVRQLGEAFAAYSGEPQDVLSHAWAVAGWPDPDGTVHPDFQLPRAA